MTVFSSPFFARRRLLLLGLVVPLVVVSGWLGHLSLPQPHHFVRRVGGTVNAEVGPVEAHAGFIGQAVRLVADTGLSVDFRVVRPAGDERRLPLVILLGGHRTGRDAVDVVGDPGAMAVAALNYPYHGPERTRGFWQTLRTVPAVRQGLLDTPPAVTLALDWLIAQPWVDASRVELMGVSLGVPFVAVAGANDSRFSRVWLIHGGANNREWLASRLESRIKHDAARHAVAWFAHLLAYGPSFDTAEWVTKISPSRVVIIGAREDEQMPRESVEQLFAAAREPKQLQWSEGGHVRPHRVDIVRQLLAMVRSGIEADGDPR